ncbi:hypothetical protein CAF53_13830 [Sphingobium sp. LB126]|uniref:hypothetical protein n=1 Tax=Sphingobium sp. LB126 TaxID=1983755 RepID=UPI000C20D842|nr:hypothetical protein [Sphingobium sp. LB126]PJG49179.1 hypothetical protein CAF53_13830 [Sphingobium sp. LB126]
MMSRIALLLAGIALTSPALARDEQYKVDVTPYLGIDQVVVAPIKGGGDVLTYTNVTAGVTAGIQTRRMEASADLQYAHSFGWGGDLGDQDIISGIVSGRYSVARGLTLNAGGLATRVRTDGLSGASVRNDGYSSQVYAGYVGPSYTTRLGDLDLGASYRLGYARVEDDVNVDFPGAPRGSSFADSTTHDLMGSVGVGPGVWMPLGLVASAGYSREDASQLDQRFEDKWARLDATLPVSPTVALIGGVGYEKIGISQRSPLLDSNGVPVISSSGRYVTDENSPRQLLYDFDDIIWDVGVLWRPSHRTSLTARVGERYGGMTYSGSFVWQGRNKSFALVVFDGIDSFGRVITSDVAALSGSDLNIVRNPFTGDFTGCAFSTTGGGQCFNDALAGVTGANFRYRGVAAQFAAERGPWGMGIGLGYSQRKFVTPSGETLFARGTRDQNWYGNASLTYRVDSQSSIDTAVYANYFDASGNRLDVLNLGAFTSYYRLVTRNLQASASVGIDSAKADKLDAVINAMGQLGLRYTF